MKRILMGAVGALVLAVALGASLLVAGLIDVSAETPHSPALYRLIEFTRERAIERSAGDITPLKDLANTDRVHRGAGNYDAMCEGCHLSPGQEDSEIRQGLYPTPPNLARFDQGVQDGDRALARRFWIIKHGIKASGMPAWSKGGMEDAAIWDLVAFLQQLPALSPEQYRQLVEASEGHRHSGIEDGHAHEHKLKNHHRDGGWQMPRHDHSEHKHAH